MSIVVGDTKVRLPQDTINDLVFMAIKEKTNNSRRNEIYTNTKKLSEYLQKRHKGPNIRLEIDEAQVAYSIDRLGDERLLVLNKL